MIDGTAGNDIIDMRGGRDVLIGSAGNDRIDGGDAGYNQIDYDGFSRDYTFAANEDGTVTVVKPNGTDIISNIGGFWFNGEQAWIPLEDLVISEPGGGPNTINGTNGVDFLNGTSRDDIIDMKGGRDVLNGSAGNDRIDGGDTGYNQIDYDGASTDYTFARDTDGTVTVTKPNGTDTLTNIGGFWFKGEGVWKALDDVLPDDDDDTMTMAAKVMMMAAPARSGGLPVTIFSMAQRAMTSSSLVAVATPFSAPAAATGSTGKAVVTTRSIMPVPVPTSAFRQTPMAA